MTQITENQILKNYLFFLSTSLFFALFCACQSPIKQLEAKRTTQEPVYRILAKPQLAKGNPQKGFAYLTEGNYIGSGVPYRFLAPDLTKVDTVLGRKGSNEKITYEYTAFVHANGTPVVAGNCFTCHASPFSDSVYFGLGNSFSNFTEKVPATPLYFLMGRKYGKDSPEWEAFYEFGNFYKAIAPHIKTEQIGTNTAFRLEEACSSHRDPITLAFSKEPVFEMSRFNIGSDVPPLWHLKKKAGIYYNGMGRGDLTKLLMQASVLGIKDSTAARNVQQHFHDVVAWLQALEAPRYPKPINNTLAVEGKMLFETHCKKCHGTYGERETYPNKIVPLAEIKTDPLYARYFLYQSGLAKWYNQSWYATSPPYSELKPSAGYIAPPLDGVWATAPYLHNGSIPTLEALLNSQKRPKVWERSGEGKDYDWENVGWNYQIPSNRKGEYVFNTELAGYSNVGHTFGDTLNDGERAAVLEYLKSL
ncbi:MAG: hypothetical protein AAF927_30625 [Bacteroidota bacterium]